MDHRGKMKRSTKIKKSNWIQPKKVAKHEGDDDTNFSWRARKFPKVWKWAGIRYQRKYWDYTDHSIFNVSKASRPLCNGDSSLRSARVLRNIPKTRRILLGKKEQRKITVTRNGINNIMINRTTRKVKWKKKKQFHGYFNYQTDKISHGKTWPWPRKWNFKRKT